MALHLHFLPTFCSFTSSAPTRLVPPRALNRVCVTQHVRCAVSTQITEAPTERRSGNYQPNTWSYDFVQSLRSDYTGESWTRLAENMKENVRHMVDDETLDPLARLELIDNIQRLGLSYHFEKDMKRAIDTIVAMKECGAWADDDLHATALHFRLLRQHGYEVSHDVFNHFKDKTGNFMARLCKDTKGMLSLYEASHLGLEGESILDEAKAFTSTHLRDLNRNIDDPDLVEQVNHALDLPLHWRMLRSEARWYINAYEKKRDMIPSLLELAKLDFNMVQAVHQKDVIDVTRWWENLGLANELSFARDRLIESFLWAMGVNHEPQFDTSRINVTKSIALITAIDDIYDVYGSLDELELFTDAVERWDINAVEQLPHYMKIAFLALYNTTNEIAYDVLKHQHLDCIPYLKKVWADIWKAHLVEAKWYYNKYTPTLEEYLNNGWISVGGPVIIAHAYFSMRQSLTQVALDCFTRYPNIIRCSSMIIRLADDLGTSTAELERSRGDVPKSIQCYMHETCASEEVGREHIRDLIDKTWKKINKDRVADSPLSQLCIGASVNLARTSQYFYHNGDRHGAPDSEDTDRVMSLLVEPISLTKTSNSFE